MPIRTYINVNNRRLNPVFIQTVRSQLNVNKHQPDLIPRTHRSGGQAISWVLGVPGASACLLEATIPYSTKACDEKMAAGPPTPGYCSREVQSCFVFFMYLCRVLRQPGYVEASKYVEARNGKSAAVGMYVARA